MAKRNFLKDLIKSLTQGELKKFSFYTKNISSPKSYLEIFNDIRKNKTAKPKKYDNKYAQQRRYLYNIILESMVHRAHDETIEGKVFFYIKSANFLLRKQLPEQAYDIINKALTLVRKYEMFGYHLAILDLEKEVRLFTNPSNYRPDNEIIEEEKNLINYQKELQTLKLIFSHIRNYKKKYGFIDTQTWLKLRDEVIEMGLLPDEHYYKTNKAKFYFFYSQALLHLLGHQFRDAYHYGKKIMDLPKTNLAKSKILNAELDYSTFALETGNTQVALETMSNIKKAFERGEYGFYERTALQIFYYLSNNELLSYAFEGEKDKIIEKLEEIENGMAYWGDKIPLEIKIILATALKLGYYAIGNYKKAIKQINLIIQNKKSGLRLDAYEDGLMYYMMYIFDKNDKAFLENEARKIYYYFKYRDLESKNDDVFTKKNLARLFLQYAMYKIDKNKMLTELKTLLTERIERYGGFMEIEYPYLIWTNSRLQNKDFIETAREMTKTYLNKIN